MVRLTDRPDMTLDVYSGRKTTTQQQQRLVTHATILSDAVLDHSVSCIIKQGPVVQSIVSLTSSLSGQLVKCFKTLYQIH